VLASVSKSTGDVPRSTRHPQLSPPKPIVASVNGGGGLTFGRWGPDATIEPHQELWVLRDVSGMEAGFAVQHSDRGPLDYPFGLGSAAAQKLGGRVIVLP
jgi:hypothetical protein